MNHCLSGKHRKDGILSRMKESTRGSVFVLFLPMSMILFLLTIFILDLGRMASAKERSQTLADVALLSSLNMRSAALASIAERWDPVGSFGTQASTQGFHAPASQWNLIEDLVDRNVKAVPGYKGRIKAVIKAVTDANDIERSAVQIIDERALGVGIQPERGLVIFEDGTTRFLNGLWVSRQWNLEDQLGEPMESALFRVVLTLPLLGSPAEPFEAHSESRARLIWAVDRSDSWVQMNGNGGFPRSWTEAVANGVLDPFRLPFFKTILFEGRKNES